MSESLPQGIVTQLESLGIALMAIAREHRDGSLATLEIETLEAVRTALPRLLEEVVKVGTTRLQPSLAHWQQSCPCCGERVAAQSWRDRKVTTVCGSISFQRPWFTCHNCQHGFSPVDRVLELEARTRLSEGFREWLIRLGATTSFADGASSLEELTGLDVSPETVRQQTERRGSAFEVKQQRASEQVKEKQAPVTALDPAPGTLVVETGRIERQASCPTADEEARRSLVRTGCSGGAQRPQPLAINATACMLKDLQKVVTPKGKSKRNQALLVEWYPWAGCVELFQGKITHDPASGSVEQTNVTIGRTLPLPKQEVLPPSSLSVPAPSNLRAAPGRSIR